MVHVFISIVTDSLCQSSLDLVSILFPKNAYGLEIYFVEMGTVFGDAILGEYYDIYFSHSKS